MPGKTISEKILASHCGEKEVFPGQIVNAKVDLLMMNELTAAISLARFKEMGFKKVFDPEAVALIPDHFVPNKDLKAAEMAKLSREFAEEYNIKHYFELGRMGIEHVILAEKGLVYPGQLLIGGDSHTPTSGAVGCFAAGVGSTDAAGVLVTGHIWLRVPETMKIIYYGKPRKWVGGKDFILYTIGKIGVDGARYRSMEFAGEALNHLPMDDRFTIANMAAEAGAKTAILEPDDITLDYLKDKVKKDFHIVRSDPDAKYVEVVEIDVSKIEPQVAVPFSPSNSKSISEVGEIKIDQSFIGSCTNGRISDLRIAASVLKGRKVHPKVRLIIIPASQGVYMEALKEGLIEIFIDAEAVVSTPTCGPCLGGHMGILASGEKAISTTNRNFRGRMGATDSEVYLCNAAVAAASAILGKICLPEEVK